MTESNCHLGSRNPLYYPLYECQEIYHIKTHFQQVSYACCTVCYAHSLADSPGCGLRRQKYVLIWRPVPDSNWCTYRERVVS